MVEAELQKNVSQMVRNVVHYDRTVSEHLFLDKLNILIRLYGFGDDVFIRSPAHLENETAGFLTSVYYYHSTRREKRFIKRRTDDRPDKYYYKICDGK